jgi:ArsR family transcriptional regulator
MEKYNNTKNICNILGNPKRFEIFSILMTGTHCNCEIAKITGYANNLISHHLKVLLDNDLIQAEKDKNDSRWIYYSVNQQKIGLIQTEITEYFSFTRIENRHPVCSSNKKKS